MNMLSGCQIRIKFTNSDCYIDGFDRKTKKNVSIPKFRYRFYQSNITLPDESRWHHLCSYHGENALSPTFILLVLVVEV